MHNVVIGAPYTKDCIVWLSSIHEEYPPCSGHTVHCIVQVNDTLMAAILDC